MVSVIKKTLHHPKANHQARINFQNRLQQYKKSAKTLVYLDESGFAHDMPRTHGYCKKGLRCYGKQDWHAKGRVNAIGAIIGMTFLTVCLFQGSVNSDVFYAWLTQDLLPKVPDNAVIIMDNASFHKRTDMVAAIEQRGAILDYLPAYSPDLNPIEQKWAQAKAIRRQYRCTVDDLFSIYLQYDTL